MNGITKQIFIGVGIALISAAVLGVQSLYSDVGKNSYHREDSVKIMNSIDNKLDKLMDHQIEMRNDISVLQSNQKLIMEGKINE